MNCAAFGQDRLHVRFVFFQIKSVQRGVNNERQRKYYIALHGEIHEVSHAVYQAYYQGKRKEKYIYEKDQVHENHILDISGMEELVRNTMAAKPSMAN